VLRVISRTPSNAQPVFEAIAQSAVRVFGAFHSGVGIVDGEEFRLVATGGVPDPRGMFRVPLDRSTTVGRSVLDHKVYSVADTEAPGVPPFARESGRAVGFRAIASAPMLREGRAIGGVTVMRKEPGAFSDKQLELLQTFADQAVIAIENARLFNETKEALERQTATSRILGVISSSPTDLQPVFDAILEHATRLCDAHMGILGVYDGKYYRTGAQRGAAPAYADYLAKRGPFVPVPGSALGRMVATGEPSYVEDVKETERYRHGSEQATRLADTGGARTYLIVPMLKDGRVVGGISIYRPEVRPFTQKQIDLVSTFANQAVIAIENVRLFNETKEALERQTAISEVLEKISGSPTDVSPVLAAVAERAARLCEGEQATMLMLEDGNVLRPRFTYSTDKGPLPNPNTAVFLDRGYVSGRAAIEGRVINVEDVAAVTDTEYPAGRQNQQMLGYRSFLAVPMMREGKAIGVIAVWRRFVRKFSEKHVALAKTFADQAAIAIENVRLFNETSEALERQTATADILKVIAASPSDVQPVFDAIAASALRLIGGLGAAAHRVIGDEIHLVALTSTDPSGEGAIRELYPVPVSGSIIQCRVVRSGAPVMVADSETNPETSDTARNAARMRGFRSIIAVPMLREGVCIGTISVTRAAPGAFSEHHIALLKTFADQAVIAIENVRLFNETKEALERQTATAEILKVISRSPTDIQPVLDAVAESAARLCGATDVVIRRLNADRLRLVAHFGSIPVPEQFLERQVLSENISGRAVLERRTIQVADVNDPETRREYPDGLPAAPESVPYRTLLAVPLVREGVSVGVIIVRRTEREVFSSQQIGLLETFAHQAVIAMENVRLFNETKEALERQTATSDILNVISRSPTDVGPVFSAIARSAIRLTQALSAGVFTSDGGRADVGAAFFGDQDYTHVFRQDYPAPIEYQTPATISMRECRVVNVANLLDGEFPDTVKARARTYGYRAVLSVPMLRGGKAIGSIAATSSTVGLFPDNHVALLQTFADQAVIAIENVRLFNETKEALERQTATAEILRVISSSPDSVQPVFDAIVNSAVRLVGGHSSIVSRVVGDELHLAAFTSLGSERDDAIKGVFPRRLDEHPTFAEPVRSKEPLSVADTDADPRLSEATRQVARSRGYRSFLLVPLVREGEAIGLIHVSRTMAGPWSHHHVELIRTFADQAVIAIENVRLFNETAESLEQQTAISDALQVISSSPTDVQPVFNTLASSARQLTEAHCAAIVVVRDESIHLAAITEEEGPPIVARGAFPMPLHHEAGDRLGIFQDISRHKFADAKATAIRLMMRAGDTNPLGAILIFRREGGDFTEKQKTLLTTFANQAVIAIENVRLFNETKEALERQTATADILRVISSSPTDVRPVLDAIVRSAVRLFPPRSGGIWMREGDKMVLGPMAGPLENSNNLEQVRALFSVLPLDPVRLVAARAIVSAEVAEIKDTESPDAPEPARRAGRIQGWRSATFVPLVRVGVGIGVIQLVHPEPGQSSLTPKQLDLVKTFADQAVIAIENVRLFKELQSQTEALTKSVGQLTALGDVGRAISSTLDLETVLKTIVSRAVQLTALDAGVIYEYDEATANFQLRAWENVEEGGIAQLRTTQVRIGEGAIGRSVVTREPEHVPDTHSPDYPAHLRERLDPFGYRSVLAVPLLRETQIVGALMMLRKQAGAFAPEVVEVLKTFGTQSAMAIQNARLYREIAEKGKQLEAASEHKSQFLASMSHELRTPLNAILGFNEMILDQIYGDVPVDMRDPLQNIQTSGKHLLRLINNVLDLAKIEAGRMELALAEYSVQEAVTSVHSTLKPLAADKGLEFVATVPADLPLAYGDAGRISQCLMNLAGNSLKFTKSGKVAISVAQQNGVLRYSVADTGIGIPPDKIGSLFTEFKQTDATIASEYGGTGLGLSITKKFIEMHGGRIWVESELGKGSSFLFEVPLRVSP
jgi:GAF domain-containing protein